jgi:hypothetical protein
MFATRLSRQKSEDIVLNNMTRSKVIQIWFAAVGLVVAAGIALGAAVTISTAALLLGMCLVPPALVLMLWPGLSSAPTIADVLHSTKRRD